MNKTFLILFCIPLALSSYSQMGITGSSGTDGALFITENTIFHVDSLIIIPTTGNSLTIENNSVVRVATPATVGGLPSIARVYDIGTAFSYIGHLGLIYRESELNGNTEGSIDVAYNNSSWQLSTGSSNGNSFGSDTNYITNTFPTSILVNNVTAAPSTTLAINFTGFTATLKGQAVVVNWETDLSTTIEGFYVQSSSNGSDWKDAGYVAAQSGREKYSYSDADIAFTVRYYRVLGIEPSGEKTYTKIAVVKQAAENIRTTVFGSEGARTIRFINDAPDGIQLYDLKGQLMRRSNTSQRDYPAFGIPAGVYVLKFSIGGEQFTKRIVL